MTKIFTEEKDALELSTHPIYVEDKKKISVVALPKKLNRKRRKSSEKTASQILIPKPFIDSSSEISSELNHSEKQETTIESKSDGENRKKVSINVTRSTYYISANKHKKNQNLNDDKSHESKKTSSKTKNVSKIPISKPLNTHIEPIHQNEHDGIDKFINNKNYSFFENQPLSISVNSNSCSYCTTSDPSSLGYCNDCNRYFCNNITLNMQTSHIIYHLKMRNHNKVSLHKESQFKGLQISCCICSSSNITIMEYITVNQSIFFVCSKECKSKLDLSEFNSKYIIGEIFFDEFFIHRTNNIKKLCIEGLEKIFEHVEFDKIISKNENRGTIKYIPDFYYLGELSLNAFFLLKKSWVSKGVTEYEMSSFMLYQMYGLFYHFLKCYQNENSDDGLLNEAIDQLEKYGVNNFKLLFIFKPWCDAIGKYNDENISKSFVVEPGELYNDQLAIDLGFWSMETAFILPSFKNFIFKSLNITDIECIDSLYLNNNFSYLWFGNNTMEDNHFSFSAYKNNLTTTQLNKNLNQNMILSFPFTGCLQNDYPNVKYESMLKNSFNGICQNKYLHYMYFDEEVLNYLRTTYTDLMDIADTFTPSMCNYQGNSLILYVMKQTFSSHGIFNKELKIVEMQNISDLSMKLNINSKIFYPKKYMEEFIKQAFISPIIRIAPIKSFKFYCKEFVQNFSDALFKTNFESTNKLVVENLIKKYESNIIN